MDNVDRMFEESFEIFIKLLSEWGDYDSFIGPIQNFRETYFQNTQKCYTPNTGPGAFNVLNHSDFHPKNVIYRMKTDGINVDDYMMVRNF